MPWDSDQLQTPIYLKIDDDFVWPETVPVFHLLTRDGLFLCRNHPFFRSSVRVENGPTELAAHAPRLILNYPKLPRPLLEQIVGFFSIIGRQYSSEATVLLAWDKTARKIEVIVPEQIGVVCASAYGQSYPLELHYEIPPPAPNLLLIGDIHSHVDAAAYASGMDKADEEFRPGLHLVVGRIQDEPPEFHCEITVDRARFRVLDLSVVIAGYRCRRENLVPEDWITKVTVKTWNSCSGTYSFRRAVRAQPSIEANSPGHSGNPDSDPLLPTAPPAFKP